MDQTKTFKKKKALIKKQQSHKFFNTKSFFDQKILFTVGFFALAIGIAGVTSVRYAMWAYSTNAQQIRFQNISKQVSVGLDGMCGVVNGLESSTDRAARAVDDACEVVSVMIPVADRLSTSAVGDESIYKIDLDPGRCLTNVKFTSLSKQDVEGVVVDLFLEGDVVGKYQLENLENIGEYDLHFDKISADFLDVKVYADQSWRMGTDYASLILETCSCKSEGDDCGLKLDYGVDLLKSLD
ncbi:hypothetical protein KKG46_05665 [Patescibacteria group bacterium]|nr:hypothetical protein [Patescibacteria group bacterium]